MLCEFFILFIMSHHFIGYLREEVPVYWVNLRGDRRSFIISVQNYAGGWLEFHFMACAPSGGLVT
mgnify:CR=1 FL=1